MLVQNRSQLKSETFSEITLLRDISVLVKLVNGRKYLQVALEPNDRGASSILKKHRNVSMDTQFSQLLQGQFIPNEIANISRSGVHQILNQSIIMK